MQIWQQTLLDFGILWLASSLITLAGILASKKTTSPLAMIGESAANGAIGAGVGISVLDKLGVRVAMALAAFTGAGLLSKEFLVRAIAKKLGVDDDRNAGS